jgi:hypothetical protein
VRIKEILAAAAIAATFAIAPASAEVVFLGSTDGCFGTGCTAGSPLTINTLTFSGVASFGGTTIGDQLSVSSFGTFSLAKPQGNDTYGAATPFTLFVSFAEPSSASPSPDLITAALSGTVAGNSSSLSINFGSAQTFNYDGGAFRLELNPLNLQVGLSANITGQLIASPVPEPATWATFILGFASIGLMAYRRRRSQPSFRFA